MKKPFARLPAINGNLLKRLGQPNALEISDAVLAKRIADEQIQRTKDRKQAQIERAMREGKKGRGKGVQFEIIEGKGR